MDTFLGCNMDLIVQSIQNATIYTTSNWGTNDICDGPHTQHATCGTACSPNELHSKLCILANIGSMEAWGTVLESSARPPGDCNFAFFQSLDGKRGIGSFEVEIF